MDNGTNNGLPGDSITTCNAECNEKVQNPKKHHLMKRCNQFCWLLFVLLYSSTAVAQTQGGCGSSGPEHYFKARRTTLPEQVTFLVSDEVIFVLECAEIQDIHTHLVDSVIHLMEYRMLPLRDTLAGLTPPLLITFEPIGNGMLRITTRNNPGPLAEVVAISSPDPYATTHFNYTIEYTIDKRHTLVIYLQRLSSFQELTRLEIGHLLQAAKEDVAKKEIARFIAKRFTYPLRSQPLVTGRSLDTAGVFIHKKADRGISLSVNTGISLLNNTFVPSVSFPVTYRQSKKTGGFQHFGIMFDMLLNMDPERPYRLQKNWYADLLFGFSESRMHLFAGYLIHREGKLIPQNACRIGFTAPIGKSGGLSFRVAYHFSATQTRQNLFETGIRFGF
jgi:hypothetical protein